MRTGAAATGDRLAKVIARSGLCSRRDAEGWIRDGRVSVNGATIRTPAFNVTERDSIAVDGMPLAARAGTRVWLYHKPAGLMVTEKDPEGRPTIFEKLEAEGLPRVLTVGRLDINTEGLLLLTNDGGLKRVLELPSTGWLRRYRVRAHGTITQPELDRLKEGVEIEGVRYGPIEATLERQQGANVWLLVALREGKNREVKNVLASLGLTVNRLIRISYGPFQLGDLPAGAVEVVRSRVLRDQLGRRLAEQAGADFESEVPAAVPPAAAGKARAPKPAAIPAASPDGRHARPRLQRDTAAVPEGPGIGKRSGRGRPERHPPPSDTRGPGSARSSRNEEGRPPRRVHFDDGRESEVFVEKTPPQRRAAGDGPAGGRSRHPADARPGREDLGRRTRGPVAVARSATDPERGGGHRRSDAPAAKRGKMPDDRSAQPPRRARPASGGRERAAEGARSSPRAGNAAQRPLTERPRSSRPPASGPARPRGGPQGGGTGKGPGGGTRRPSRRPRPPRG